MLAAFERGEGCFIDISLADSINTFNTPRIQSVLMGDAQDGSMHHVGEPRAQPGHRDYGTLKCKDGKFITQANVEPRNWQRFVATVGLPELEQLPTLPRGPERDALIEKLRAAMLTRSRDEWFDVFINAGCTIGSVKDVSELVEDPQLNGRGMFWELDHPAEGRVKQLGFPIIVKDQEAKLRKFAPAQGEDTRSILDELGYSPAEIEALLSAGAVRGQAFV
jgi:crotonobetainyl-CoA:carnitine CoA-transferase CaiB-like acyl-CoA transferase